MNYKRMTYYQSNKKLFGRKLKKDLNNRIDQFLRETNKTLGTTEEWMKEYVKWKESER